MSPLHKKVFELLCEIDDICKKHNITYYLIAGSALGAVRHKSIIPWDDDIDIGMTRSNWEKFKNIIEKELPSGREILTFEKYPDFRFIYPQYKNVKTSLFFRSGVLVDYPLGIFIDFILLDPVKNQQPQLDRHMETLKILGELISPYYIVNRTTNFFEYKFYKFLCKIFGKKKIIDYLQSRLVISDDDNCDGYVQRISVFTVYIDKEFVGKPDKVELYGRRFPTMTNVYGYLRFAYGDSWMHFPPNIADEGHGFLYDADYPYQVFLNDYKAYIDKAKYKKAWLAYKYWRFKAVKPEDETKKANLLRLALIYKLQIDNKIKDIDIINLYKSEKIIELQELFSDYFKWQLSSDFIKNEILIPVSEEIMYVLCMLLVLDSQYYNANNLLQLMNCSEEKSWYQDLKNAIEASRALSIAFYEEHENWKHIEELVNEYLPKFPHHVDFITAKCKLILRSASKNMNMPNKVLEICYEELKYHNKNAYLFDVMADALVKLGDLQSAVMYYRKAYRITDDGMLQQKIRSKTVQFGIDLDLTSEENVYDLDSNQEYYQEQVKKVQKGIGELLNEFDEICRKESIPYFLGGYLAAEAKELGTFAPECCSAYIVMHPADRNRLIDAVKKYAKSDRVLESFESNSDYPDFSMRYCNINTTLFDVRTEGFYKYHGLNLTIYFVRPAENNVWKCNFSTELNAVVEADAFSKFYYNITNEKILAGFLGEIMFLLIGKKLFKKLAWNIIYHPNNKNYIVKGSIKDYWYKPIQLPEINFNKFQECSIDGVVSRIPVNYKDFIRPQIIRNWNNGCPIGRLLKFRFYSAMEINCTEFAEGLKKLGVKNTYFKYLKKLSNYNAMCDRESSYAFYYSWYISQRSVARIQMWKKYAPLKEQIITLYKEKNFDELYRILEEYIKVLKENISHGMAVVFDEEIFRITRAVLDKKGESGLVKLVLPKIPAAHFNPILLSCGKVRGMKKAREQDKGLILNYLAREEEQCLYMYADIEKYGLNKPYLTVWYDEDDLGIRMVVMKYYNSFQLYSNRGFSDVAGVIDLINQKKPFGISARKEIISQIQPLLEGEYTAEYGVIFKGKPIDKVKLKIALEDCKEQIELAKPRDAREIAELICMDEEMKGIYTINSLARELTERIKSGMGRSYIIRKNGKIVAHNASYAECTRFVVVSGLMVHPDYRDTEYAYWIDLKSSMEFQKEGKNRYFFAIEKKIIRWHKRINTPLVAEYGKLALINKKK